MLPLCLTQGNIQACTSKIHIYCVATTTIVIVVVFFFSLHAHILCHDTRVGGALALALLSPSYPDCVFYSIPTGAKYSKAQIIVSACVCMRAHTALSCIVLSCIVLGQ